MLTSLQTFLLQTAESESVPELLDVAFWTLGDRLNLPDLAIFLQEGGHRFVLKRDSGDILAGEGITELPSRKTAPREGWPCLLSELLSREARRSGPVAEYWCRPIDKGDEIQGIFAWRRDPAQFEGEENCFLDLALTQMALSLSRIEKERRIKRELFCQIDEMAELEHRILRSERRSCMAEMALGVADGIRNPLTVIGALVGRISRNMGEQIRSKKEWAHLSDELQRLDGLIRDFERFAKKRHLLPERRDILEVVRKTVDIVKEGFKHTADIAFSVVSEQNSFIVSFDRTLMGAALTHVLLNASEAVEGEGEIQIHMVSASSGVTIRIRDNGKGIPPHRLDRVFEPFFTTKPGGTGLGLTYVQQIINEHQGDISIESRPQVGTTVTITLPNHPTL